MPASDYLRGLLSPEKLDMDYGSVHPKGGEAKEEEEEEEVVVVVTRRLAK